MGSKYRYPYLNELLKLYNVLVNQLFQRVLILDVTGFDVPYTPTEFPAGYVLTGNWPAEPNGDNYEYQNLIDKFYTEITLTTFNVPNGTQVPYTITGTGIFFLI